MWSTICGRTGGRLIGFVFFHLRRLAALALRLVNQSDTAATAQQEVEGAKRRKEKKLRQAPKIRLAWASRARPTFQTDRDSSLAFCLPLRQSHSPRNTLWSILNELASAASCFASSVSLCPPSTGQQVEAFEIWRQTIRFEFHLTRNFECSNNNVSLSKTRRVQIFWRQNGPSTSPSRPSDVLWRLNLFFKKMLLNRHVLDYDRSIATNGISDDFVLIFSVNDFVWKRIDRLADHWIEFFKKIGNLIFKVSRYLQLSMRT